MDKKEFSMKNILKLIGIAALVAVIGFSFAACDSGGGGGGGGGGGTSSGSGKSITISGITGKSGGVLIGLMSDGSGIYSVAGVGTISGGSVTTELLNVDTEKPYTGSGSYYLFLDFENGDLYIYTNGSSLAALGISDLEDDYAKLPKYTISSANSSIAFSRFVKY
jgi:hypothetical protein